jgi:hypothetical protein
LLNVSLFQADSDPLETIDNRPRPLVVTYTYTYITDAYSSLVVWSTSRDGGVS